MASGRPVYTERVPPVKDPHLKLMSLRLDKRDLAVARKEGKRRDMPYQHVLRGWVTSGADRARRPLAAKKSKSKPTRLLAKAKA